MGLDTSHDAWHGSYLGFSKWRSMLAVAAGIIRPGDLLFPRSAYDDKFMNDTPIDWELIDQDTDYMGNWTNKPRDPLFYLLAHSDCDGVIKPEHMIPLAQRLEEFADDVDDNYGAFGFRPTRRFIDGLVRAHKANEEIDFH